jgi:hypothetical protein
VTVEMRIKFANGPSFTMKGSRAQSLSSAMTRLLILQFGRLGSSTYMVTSSIPCTFCRLFVFSAYVGRSPTGSIYMHYYLFAFVYRFVYYSLSF